MNQKINRNDLLDTLEILGRTYLRSDVEAALAATGKQQVGETEPADDDWHLRGYAYASKQATTCAGCGKHKHTPLRIDAMGGYVCLTCIDQKLSTLLKEFGYQSEQVGEMQDDWGPMTNEQVRQWIDACNSNDARQFLRAAIAARQPVGQDHLRKAIATVCEGWTLPADARKILEKAMWEYTPSAETRGEAAQ